uniref:hypothetical protein n=1 Tax=Tahibacter caeni TaxID=1453545 RepID=UPI002147DD06
EADGDVSARVRAAARLALAVALCRHGAATEGRTLLDASTGELLADVHVAPGERAWYARQALACAPPH